MKTKQNLVTELEHIYNGMLVAADQKKDQLSTVKPHYRYSAVNLVEYLSLRSTNIEAIQKQLHGYGLSSLASSESHIKSQLVKIMEWLGHITPGVCETDAESGLKQLQKNISTLLGTPANNETTPVMITFDTDFAKDNGLICDLLKNGMQVARINCAHDNQSVWVEMIENLKKAMKQTSKSCKLYMDMAGPKIRTQIIIKNKKDTKLEVGRGDEIILTDPDQKTEKHKKYICCTLPGIVQNLEPGHRVFFDDGLFEAVVKSVDGKQATLNITRILTKKPFIKSEKGINFPDTTLKVNPITVYDEECLPFITQHADMLGFSFVNSAMDVQQLQTRLSVLNVPNFPVVAKIETKEAVNNLPGIILQGMQQDMFGVMVARGDMAIEIGFERMSEIQDEILWICEAAHTPVIWATQVLENMNRLGIATRSEITDAAHAAAADCVMLNKGDHIVEVLKSLNDILGRSRKNNFKNRRLFRKLSIADNFFK